MSTKRYWSDDARAYIPCEIWHDGRGATPQEQDDAAYWERISKCASSPLMRAAHFNGQDDLRAHNGRPSSVEAGRCACGRVKARRSSRCWRCRKDDRRIRRPRL